MEPGEGLLRMAEDVGEILQRHHVEAVVIGAVALAAHHYVRYTQDIDLAVNADVETLRHVADGLRDSGYTVELREPDGEDPLGGVLDVFSPSGTLQIISFAHRFPLVIEESLREATLVARSGSSLRIAPIPQLIALKLYAGGLKSKADIAELLSRNPDVDLVKIQEVCDRYRLRGFRELLSELRN